MSFTGDVRSMALEEVFGFLSQNGLTGSLAVQSGDEVSLRLYFSEGSLFFPDRSRRGTYHLGKILRHTGVLSREGLAGYLSDLSARKKQLADDDSPGVQQAKQMQFTEEIHDLFLWGDARFEFKPGPWPARVQADHKAGRGLQLVVSSLLMDVARRVDERRRIRASLPSSRLVLRTEEGRAEAVLSGLKEAGIEVSSDPFDGEVDLDQLLADWGAPHHEALSAVGLLLEAGVLAPLPLEEARERLRERMGQPDYLALERLLGHWAELRAGGERFGLDVEQELITSPAFTQGPEGAIRFRLSGPRVFTLLRVLLSLQSSFTLRVFHRGETKRVDALPGEVSLSVGERREAPCAPLVDYLVRQGALKKEVGQAWKGHPPEERPSLRSLVSQGQFDAAQRAKLVDELAELAFWGRADVELRNRCQPGNEAERLLVLPLDDEVRGKISEGLEEWAGVFELVPGEEALYVPKKAFKEGDPAGRFFQRFGVEANVGELRRRAQTTELEFVRFVQQGLRRGYIQPASMVVLSEHLADAKAAGNDVQSYRLALAGQCFGYPGFPKLVAELGRRTDLPSPFPGLEGDLDGTGLGAVLQALRNHRRTGSLVVRAGRREERLHFHRGDAFLLKIEGGEDDAFVAFFLDDDEGGGLFGDDDDDEEGGGEASEELVEGLKASFLDVLLWDGSTFAWFPNSLPDEFYAPGKSSTKVALNTDVFLLEAIQTMAAWEDVAEVIGGGRSTFEFTSTQAKMAAIRDRGHPEILTLIDGRLTFDDLARISGVPRLEVGEVLADLVREDLLRVDVVPADEETARLEQADLPDPVMD